MESPEYTTIEDYFLDAVKYGDNDEVNYCLTQKLNPLVTDSNGNNCIHLCSANGENDILVSIFEKYQGDIFKELVLHSNIAGNTPLHWAVINNQIDSIKLLLHFGSSCKIKNKLGQTPLDISEQLGLYEAFSIIISEAVDIEDLSDPHLPSPDFTEIEHELTAQVEDEITIDTSEQNQDDQK